ncbi:MAG: hypothetical protein HOW97_03450 [Catenulispora sp.]|nr:hypothetical protein [Catenulispora sp.]NUR60260.1 hypothetical protein [Catenulispora sp.]
MPRIVHQVAACAAVGFAAAALAAGCSSSATTAPAPGATPNPQAPTSAAGAVVAVHDSQLGKILVDGQGRTLYLFESDTPTTSTCYGNCTTAWPPYTTAGAPQAGAGVIASKLGTLARTDGGTEITYNGHPLYYYRGDQNPGDTTGQGNTSYGAPWYVLDAGGNAITGG